jgi:AcrR family transcriptional regulator
MGRTPTISREALLVLAEEIVNEHGPQALTIDALAKAAGISKGGVQYSFASKDQLISALLQRWRDQFDSLLPDIDAVTPTEFVRSYLAAMRTPQGAFNAKSASLMIAQIQDPQHRAASADWYRVLLGKIGHAPGHRPARIAFLAIEGLFLARLLGVDDDTEWQASLDDIEGVLGA